MRTDPMVRGFQKALEGLHVLEDTDLPLESEVVAVPAALGDEANKTLGLVCVELIGARYRISLTADQPADLPSSLSAFQPT